jgi:predicted PurR-regulated permease PerM
MSTSPLPVTSLADEAAIAAPRREPTYTEVAAWLIIGVALVFVMLEHVVSALVGGLVLYLVLDRLAVSLSRRFPSAARGLALTVVTIVVGAVVGGGFTLAVFFLRHRADRIPAMMTKMAEILQSTRAWLGDWGGSMIPGVLTDAETFKASMVTWLKENAAMLKIAGGSFSNGVLHMIMGMLLAILVFFRHVRHEHPHHRGTLSEALTEKVARLAIAFKRIATAQVKISALNTTLTAIYLFGVLPMFGHRLPFSTTIVMITFVCGLIPVLGNLISNAVIVILSLGISVGVAVASLVFLILIHKLEYLVNSRIVGGETDSQAWEILLAILIGETAFGVAGVVMAPIIYTFVKGELREYGLV